MNDTLLSWDNYYNRFIYYISEGYTHEKAFELLQEDFEDETGFEVVEVRGFISYNSFKNRITKEHQN